jgi:hypothetical protein
MPSSSASKGGVKGCADCSAEGSSPVLVGLMYEINVDEEPSPGMPPGGMASGMLFLLDDSWIGALIGFAAEGGESVGLMDGKDATVLSVSFASFDLVFSRSGEA